MNKDLTIRGQFKEGCSYLKQQGIETAAEEMTALLCLVLEWDRAKLFACAEQSLSFDQLQKLHAAVKKRGDHWPFAYISGKREFMGMEMMVDPSVLIPRPETELLVEKAVECAGSMSGQIKIADVCTGSGAVALALARFLPQAMITGLDISADALRVAEENARLLDAKKLLRKEQLQWQQGDLLQTLLEQPGETAGRFDIITSNPPYVTEKEMAELQPEVAREPHMALAGGRDGLRFYPGLISQAVRLLRPRGWLLCEIGYRQGAAVKDLFAASGLSSVLVLQDYAGHDRVVMGQQLNYS